MFYKSLRIYLVLWSLTVILLEVIGNPVDSFDEDDEDIIKHFEDMLKESSDEPKSAPDIPRKGSNSFPKFTSEPAPIGKGTTNDFSDGNYNSDQAELGGCVCKKYYECKVTGNESVSGPHEESATMEDLPEVDVRWGDSIQSKCSHYFEVCCANGPQEKVPVREPDFEHTVCGKRNLNGVGFRVKGAVNQEAQFGEFPWMAAIVSPEPQEGRGPLNVFVCGGSLVHPGVVLTAAHCVYQRKPQELIVRLGEWDTQTSHELYPHQDFFVEKIAVHDDFYAGALYNDVALLFLTKEAKLAPHIDTVCLPPSNINFDGTRCFASGWGRDSFGQEGRYEVILKKLDLPVVPRERCEDSLRRTRLGRYFKLDESFVCAGGEKGKDTCRGDGGSPLVCKVPGSESYVQFGIVAWGIGCGEQGVPGVYVNVPKFTRWISKQMREAGFNTNYFKLGRKLF